MYNWKLAKSKIQKERRASLTCSDNKRVMIALCNSICILINIVMLDKCSDVLTLECLASTIWSTWYCISV